MPSLAEILAAKKAASAGLQPIKPVDPTVINVEAKEIPAPTSAPVVKTLPEPVKEEPATTAAPKPLTFAEKMALKKQQATAQDAAAPSSSVNSQSVTATSTMKQTESGTSTDSGGNTIPDESPKSSAATVPAPSVAQSVVQVAPTLVKEDSGTQSSDEVSVETRQAYSDIKEKIALLNTMSGDDLKNAMSNLKKALMANPAAVSLMEDTDIGQMVIGLRKLTGQDIAEASKEKKGGGRKASKQIDLSDPDAVASVLDAL